MGGSIGPSKPRRSNWYLSARGSPKKAASETEAQHTATAIMASKKAFEI